MTLRELILKLQELEKKYEQYSQDTEVVLAIHSKNEFNPEVNLDYICLLYTSPSPRDRQKSRMPSSA